MTKSELNRFKNILQDRQSELAMVLRKREGIAIEKSPDALDEVQHAAERELAIRNLDRESNLLRNVKGALQRIQEGSYGVCLNCEEPINPKRLDAVPGPRSVSGVRKWWTAVRSRAPRTSRMC